MSTEPSVISEPRCPNCTEKVRRALRAGQLTPCVDK